jgi:hypothetical protein
MNSHLERLEELLKKGDLDAAASELEELANMVENIEHIFSCLDAYDGFLAVHV